MTPTIRHRPAQPYVAVRDRLSRERLAEIVPQQFAAMHEWLGTRELAPAGPPFVRYLVVGNLDGTVEVEVGVPLSALPSTGDGVTTGTLPAGRYAVSIHRGPYDDLVSTTRNLLEWGDADNAAWAMDEAGQVTAWSGRVEHYVTGPAESATPDDWRTEVAILLAES